MTYRMSFRRRGSLEGGLSQGLAGRPLPTFNTGCPPAGQWEMGLHLETQAGVVNQWHFTLVGLVSRK